MFVNYLWIESLGPSVYRDDVSHGKSHDQIRLEVTSTSQYVMERYAHAFGACLVIFFLAFHEHDQFCHLHA